MDITTEAGAETIATFNMNGAVELYYDNSKKFDTVSGGTRIFGYLSMQGSGGHIYLPDSAQLKLGNGEDLQIYHNGTNSIINHTLGSGALRVQANDVRLMNNAGNEHFFVGFANDYAGLYFDNSQKLKTTSAGVTVTGQLSTTDTISTVGNLDMSDSTSTGNNRIRLGTGDDLEIYHNGTLNIIDCVNGNFQLMHGTEKMIAAVPDGQVELWYDNSKKFETNQFGAVVVDTSDETVQLRLDNNSGIAGYLFCLNSNTISLLDSQAHKHIQGTKDGDVELYYDNSKKLETSSTGGIFRGTTWTAVDDCKIAFGSGDDLQIFHDGSNSVIRDNGTGNLYLQVGTSNKFNTQSGGVQFYGSLYGDDNNKIELGNDQDLQIYHNGSHSIAKNGTGDFYLAGDSVKLVNAAINEDMLVAEANGAVKLYYNNSQKFETTSDGALVSGRLAIGASAANNKINVLGAAGNGQTTLYYGFGTIDLTSASDERVKNNVVNTAKGLDDILKLRIVDFTYTPEYAEDSTTVRTGGIAQEWQKVDSNLVNTENEDLLFIEYKRVIPHLIKAVQELSAKVTALEAA